MDPTEAMDLNARDTEYMGDKKPLACIDFTRIGPLEYSFDLAETSLNTVGDLSNLPAMGTRVLFLYQSRLYSTSRSCIQLNIESTTWQSLLTALMIPPVVVELLHDNNGCSWQHVSHCDDNRAAHGGDDEQSGPCAYHISFKTSHFELVYARHDFHSKRNLVLVMGDSLDLEIQRLASQLRGVPSVHVFHILLAVLSTWLEKLEQSRRSLDFDVMLLEQQTGFGKSFDNIQPPQQGRLSQLWRETAGAHSWIKSVVRHSKCAGEHFKFLAEALSRFQALQGCRDEILKQQILDAIGQYQSQQKSQAVQAEDLSWRIDTQWSVLVALLAKNDSDVTIAMAQDARTDGLLMRKMAAVSIIFLPATFLATFFSMVFFQVDVSGALSMNRNIWVYFASTSAMSLLIGLYFRFGRHCTSFALGALQKVQRKGTLPACEKVEKGIA
ncbi:hypothetical protein H2200_007821 [Cladophialophora chaetospira]|uniref:Uncharacterized protein n=1 Tax=Cladophialophora chaetospira TaxID=386627 RepID=A0AA38X6L8_9EURO|nr:hypothetical protein H2200_007821 [Cladophialophora chaetospira]